MREADLKDRLLVEIGGTHTRCAVSGGDGAPEHIRVFDNIDHDGLASVIDEYLGTLQGALPRRAALAVAAPVHRRPVPLTNLGWSIDPEALKQRFNWDDTTLVNDFEALACAVPLLAPGELMTVHAGTAVPGTAIAVLGPGTGLGVSGLVPCGTGWVPISGEGGHVTLAAADDEEAQVLSALRRRHGHVSAERVLCGAGLLGLYQLIAETPSATDSAGVTRLMEQGDGDAARAFDLFSRFLGTVAGDLALTLGARGGVYLGGGILPQVRDRLPESGFNRRFLGKGRFEGYLEDIPVHLILADTPALRGLGRHPGHPASDS